MRSPRPKHTLQVEAAGEAAARGSTTKEVAAAEGERAEVDARAAAASVVAEAGATGVVAAGATVRFQ